MTGLSDNPAPADIPVLGPVTLGNRPGIHSYEKSLRCLHSAEKLLHPSDLGREPTVETHHQLPPSERLDSLTIGAFDLLQLIEIQRQRLFHKHVFAREKGFRDKRSVAVVPCDDGDGVRSEEHTSELQSIMRNSYAV